MSSTHNLTPAQKEAYARVSNTLRVVNALEFRHPTFAAPLRIVQGMDEITCVLEADAPVDAGQSVTFSAFAFQSDEPGITTDPDNALNIRLDGISGIFQEAFATASESNVPISVTIRPLMYDVFAKGNGAIQASYHVEVQEIRSNMTSVAVKCGFSNPANKAFPNVVYSEQTNPSLV